jgi:transcriptional regulator with XRE-family HTH domain
MPKKWIIPTSTVDINAQLGLRLRRARKSARLSAETLGIIIGVSKSQILKYESGKTPLTVERVCQLAEQFRLPLIFFYGSLGEDDKWHNFVLKHENPNK